MKKSKVEVSFNNLIGQLIIFNILDLVINKCNSSDNNIMMLESKVQLMKYLLWNCTTNKYLSYNILRGIV